MVNKNIVNDNETSSSDNLMASLVCSYGTHNFLSGLFYCILLYCQVLVVDSVSAIDTFSTK